MKRNTESGREPEDLTGVEQFFLEAGLPVVEVEAFPVADCPVCQVALLEAA